MLVFRRRHVVAAATALLLCLGGCGQAGKDAPVDAPARALEFQHRLPAYGGALLGSNHGEFGGGLAFRSRTGALVPLIKENVVGLHATKFGLVAVTGFAHLRTNEGEILVISRSGGDRLRVNRLAVLPSAPMQTRQRNDGGIEMRLFTGMFAKNGDPVHDCWLLDAGSRLHRARRRPDWPVDKGWGQPGPAFGATTSSGFA